MGAPWLVYCYQWPAVVLGMEQWAVPPGKWWGFDVWTSETYGPLQWSVASKKRNASGGAGNGIHRPYSKGPLLVVIAVLGDT